MSKLKEFRNLEQALKLQQEKLHALAHDEQLERDLEFEKKLMLLLKRYRLDMHDLQDFIPPITRAPALAVREKPARYKTDKSKGNSTKKGASKNVGEAVSARRNQAKNGRSRARLYGL